MSDSHRVPDAYPMRKVRRLNEVDAGFTLVEVLVVAVIIGVLASIAIPVFLNMRTRGHTATAQSDLRNTATAMEAYFADNQTYGSANQLISSGNKPTVSSGTTIVIVQRTLNGYCLAALRNVTAVPTSAAALATEASAWFDSAGGLQPQNATGCPTTTGYSTTWQTDTISG